MAAQRRAFASPFAAATGASKSMATKASGDGTKAKAKPRKSPSPPKEKKAAPPKPKSPKQLTQEQKAALPPKRLPTPFVRFHTSRIREVNANASEESKMDIRDIARESGRLWKEMTLTEKAKWAIGEDEMKDYLKRIAEWEKSIDRTTLDAINKSRKAKGQSKIRVPAEAKRPAGPYALYTKDFYSRHIASDLSPDEKSPLSLMAKAAETWKTLSDSEKKVYEQQSAALYAEYYAKEGRDAPIKRSASS